MNNTTKFNTNKTCDSPLFETATINAQSIALIEKNEDVNQEYTILYHNEIFDKKNVIEMTKKKFPSSNSTTIQINEIDTI